MCRLGKDIHTISTKLSLKVVPSGSFLCYSNQVLEAAAAAALGKFVINAEILWLLKQKCWREDPALGFHKCSSAS